ncbi:MAG: DUF3052 family protein [Pseudomonadota bacterium]
MAQAGNSGRPLSAKLGLKPGMTCWRHEMPEEIAALLDQQEPGQLLQASPSPGLSFAHVFTKEREELSDLLEKLRNLLAPDGMIWVSWPKKSSKIPTTITEDAVREVCLPTGLVDVKVCAVDTIWSGLKLMIRKELRKEHENHLNMLNHADRQAP